MATFVDEVVIHAAAGDGGDGVVAWRREKYVPRGGPAGGDGGDGGSVILKADPNVRSLLDFRYRPHVRAKPGQNGRSKGMFGARGEDAVVKVPVGTQVFDEETGVLVCDLDEPGAEAVVCQGGSGGHGNMRFATATRQAPDFAKPGLPGEVKKIRLSLKLLADVGLLGFPNAGKSTLLSVLSAARPKIADYPFTTLVPNLGVVRGPDESTFVMADIPGIIEGASEGAGLGVRFLKHLERVRVLCHIVELLPPPLDGEARDPNETLLRRYESLRGELAAYDRRLAEVSEVVVVNKADLVEGDAREHPEVRALEEHLAPARTPLLCISAASKVGLEALRNTLFAAVAPEPHEARAQKKPFDPLAKERLR